MAEVIKEFSGAGNLISDLKSLFSVLRARRTMLFAYVFMFTFVACTAFIAFSPSASSSPWFTNIFGSSSSSSTTDSSPYRSQFSSIFSYLFPNSSQPVYDSTPMPLQSSLNTSASRNTTILTPQGVNGQSSSPKNQSRIAPQTAPRLQQSQVAPPTPTPTPTPLISQSIDKKQENPAKINASAAAVPLSRTENRTESLVSSSKSDGKVGLVKNGTDKVVATQPRATNLTASLSKGNNGSSAEGSTVKQVKDNSMESLMHCNIFDGRWVRDDSYPLYPPGSCPHIDESFNCFLNSRPDGDYQKLRWQPNGCNIPRLNGRDMLELLRGKRLVFVGDSLNRNMWESLVCILRHSVKDKSRVFEASGRHEFRTEGAYSFIFRDYNCSVDFFRSPFLVQEWEMPDTNGSKHETLRLDIIERKSDRYKTADIIIFNTGHWWTHEKTSKGKDYYQEGSHVYGELNVVEAFRRALTTWARWVDAKIDPKKTMVFFRGYSASHFR
uniref:Protein trichome birefringence-like n=1 Tax=Nelumbo nucifera TaxID=4432 RepID=A0A822Y7N1_NELNU|nr:TPA_asm: hypothetical protein HUJ06_031502 [Nelumbo nucifera]